jgi:CDP-4-dehydro-6-deoxyglucose reductase, E1
MQLQPFYKKYAKIITSTVNTNHLHECGFYFGNYPELTQEDLFLIKEALSH